MISTATWRRLTNVGIRRLDEKDAIHGVANVVVKDVVPRAKEPNHTLASEALSEEFRLELVAEKHQVLQRVRPKNGETVRVTLEQIRANELLVEV